jgi:hypothetical protein
MVPHEFLCHPVLAKPTGKRGQGPILANHTKSLELENLVGQWYHIENLTEWPLTKVTIETRYDYSLCVTHEPLDKRPEPREKLSLVYGHNVMGILDTQF